MTPRRRQRSDDNVDEYFSPVSTDHTGCYLPHVFDTRRSSRKVSIIHLLLKSMPQRCQFRNFNNVVLHNLETVPGKIEWFKKMIVWCLMGHKYKWAARDGASCAAIRKGLSSALCDPKLNWADIVKDNLNLVFYAVKEYFVWAVQQQPSLRQWLIAAFEWGVYEQEIFLVMNKVRSLYRASVAKHTHGGGKKRDDAVLKKINHYLSTFSPNQMKCLRKMFSTQHKVMFVNCGLRYTAEPILSYTQLKVVEMNLRERAAQHTEWFWLQHLQENEHEAEVKAFWNTLPADLQQLLFNYMYAANILRNIKITKLPIEYANAQVQATVKKFDVALSQSDCRNIQQVTNSWFCITCRRFRGFLANNKTRNRNHGVNISAYGHEKMAINMHNGNVYCVASSQPSNKGARGCGAEKDENDDDGHPDHHEQQHKKKPSCKDTPCIRINLLGRFVSFFDQQVTLCTKCASPCVTNVNSDYIGDGMICCGLCSSRSVCSNTSFCGYCMHRCTVLREFRMYDDTQSPNTWTSIRLCPKHRSSLWGAHTILLKSLFWKMMERES